MSTKQQPRGDTSRIAPWEAAATFNGVTLVRFASFDFENEDPQEREDAVDGARVHFDQLENPSGNCSVYPTSPSAPALLQAVMVKQIGSGNIVYPQEDTMGTVSFVSLRFENFQQEELAMGGGYQYTADWNADFMG